MFDSELGNTLWTKFANAPAGYLASEQGKTFGQRAVAMLRAKGHGADADHLANLLTVSEVFETLIES